MHRLVAEVLGVFVLVYRRDDAVIALRAEVDRVLRVVVDLLGERESPSGARDEERRWERGFVADDDGDGHTRPMRHRRFAPRLIPIVVLGAVAACGGAAATSPASTVAVTATSAVASLPEPAPASSTKSEDAALGEIDFAITGSTECRHRFRGGMLALHSFLYDQAHESFTAALAADPHCAMAAWGDAMAYDHPVWGERDLRKGREALARAVPDDGVTAKERAYLDAARALYAQDGLSEAHRAWLTAAAAMHAAYPDDDEVTLQHVLALLSVYGYDRAHVREQMEAGAMALDVLQRHPRHPGAAHYVIHAFDNPEHAILALPAARAYAQIAPAGSHALHMPSHIFTQLGMWREVVPSNEHAFATSVAWEKAHGHTPSLYDWHAYSWLVAARLELGQFARARKLVDDAAAILVAAKDDSAMLRAAYSTMVTDYVTQTDRWGDVEALVAPVFAPSLGEAAEGSGPVACAMHAPAAGGAVRLPGVLFARMDLSQLRAEAAIRARDESTAVKRVDDMKSIRAQMAPWAKMFPPGLVAALEVNEETILARAHAAAAPSAASQKKALEALSHLERVDASQPMNGGPAWQRTTRETLGDALLAMGKAKEALVELEADLEEHPKRALALLGAARAAKAVGDLAKSRARYATLADLWSEADPDVPALAEVTAGAK